MMNGLFRRLSAPRRTLCAFLTCLFVFSCFLIARPAQSAEPLPALSKLGSSGDEVRQIQKKLKTLGYYNGAVDGLYGGKTQSAVKAFQKSCGITADGVAGPTTLLYLGLDSGLAGGGLSSSDAYLLAKLIAAEARGESYTGQVAVGAVILNRVRHPSFPNTIAGVLYQPGAFSALADGQFSREPEDQCRRAARDAMNGWDPTGGAIYYYNPKKSTSRWIFSRPTVAVIGEHVFAK